MRTVTAMLLVVLMGAAAMLTAAPAGAAPDPAGPDTTVSMAATPSAAEFEALELINAERRARGLGSLPMQPGLADIAREWSVKLRSDQRLSHRTDLAGQVVQRVTTGWLRLGENVGTGSSVQWVHDTFMGSAAHRSNILGDYTTAGVGIVEDGSRSWVTVVFLKSALPLPTVAPGPGGFCDTAGNVHGEAIATLTALGITKGSNGCYHPQATVTRGQMATFLKRALGLTQGTATFCDVAGNVHAGSIGMVAHAGIALGMPDGCFRPQQGVTRGQMAAFLDRAFDFPEGAAPFVDTAGHQFAAEIARVAAAGVSVGDGNGRFHPDALVTRAQMASFLVRSLEA